MAPTPSIARLLAFGPKGRHRALEPRLLAFLNSAMMKPTGAGSIGRAARDPYLAAALEALSRDAKRSLRLREAAFSLLAAMQTVFLEHEHEHEQEQGTEPQPEQANAAGASGMFAMAGRAARLLDVLSEEAGVVRTAAQHRHTSAPAGPPDTRGGAVMDVALWLPEIRSPFNVGNMIRTAGAFGLRGVVLGPRCPGLDHPRLRRSAMGAERLLSVRVGGEADATALLRGAPALGDAATVVLETGGIPAQDFRFPTSGVIACGHEQLGTDPALVERARAEGRLLSIAHGGPKASLNVGVALGVALSYWYAHQLGRG